MDRNQINNICVKLGIKLVKPENKIRYSRRVPEAPESYHRLANYLIAEERKRIAADITHELNKMRSDQLVSDENFGKLVSIIFDSINDSHSKES